jgi:hypothetical protein
MTKRDKQIISALQAAANKITDGLSEAELDRIDAAHALYRRILDHYQDMPIPPGQYGGFIGLAGNEVLLSIIKDFLYCPTGRIEPSYGALAWVTGRSISTIRNGVNRLKELGIVDWDTSRDNSTPCRLNLPFATGELPAEKVQAISASRMDLRDTHLDHIVEEQ